MGTELRTPRAKASIYPDISSADPRDIHTVRPTVVTAEAPAAPDLRRLTIQRAVDIALRQNPQIRALRNELEANLERIVEAESLPDPTFNASIFLEQIQTAAGQQELVAALSQRIPWLEKLAEAGDAQAATASAVAARLQDAILDVANQTRIAYLELYYVDQSLRRLRELEQLVDTQLIPDIREKIRVGQAGLESLYEAETQLELLRNQIRALHGQRDAVVARLLSIMGITETVTVELAVAALPPYDPPHRAELFDTLEEHPLLVARASETDAQRHRVRLADLELVPDFTIGVQWSAISSSGISPVANGNDAVAAVVGLNLPIYLDRINARRRAARADLARLENLEELTLLQLQEQLDAAFSELNARHAQRVREEESILPRLRQAIEVGREAYRVGRITTEQYIQLWRELITEEVRLYRLLTEEYQALSRVERWSGRPVFPGREPQ